jgi:hypothetical protein
MLLESHIGFSDSSGVRSSLIRLGVGAQVKYSLFACGNYVPYTTRQFSPRILNLQVRVLSNRVNGYIVTQIVSNDDLLSKFEERTNTWSSARSSSNQTNRQKDRQALVILQSLGITHRPIQNSIISAFNDA